MQTHAALLALALLAAAGVAQAARGFSAGFYDDHPLVVAKRERQNCNGVEWATNRRARAFRRGSCQHDSCMLIWWLAGTRRTPHAGVSSCRREWKLAWGRGPLPCMLALAQLVNTLRRMCCLSYLVLGGCPVAVGHRQRSP
jgi:hypothetical protein